MTLFSSLVVPQISCDIRIFVSLTKMVVFQAFQKLSKLGFVISVVNNTTIILLNNTEYRHILSNTTCLVAS